MGLIEVLLIFGLLLSLFVVLGLKRSWRIAVPLLLCLAVPAFYALFSPVSAKLNESDRMGNGAARLLLVLFALSSGAAFGGAYAVSVWNHRKPRTDAQAGIE